jgi:hypothetical protein
MKRCKHSVPNAALTLKKISEFGFAKLLNPRALQRSVRLGSDAHNPNPKSLNLFLPNRLTLELCDEAL